MEEEQITEQLGWMLFLKIFDDKDLELEMMDDNYKSLIPKKYQWRKWAADEEGMTGDELQKFIDQQLFPARIASSLRTSDHSYIKP